MHASQVQPEIAENQSMQVPLRFSHARSAGALLAVTLALAGCDLLGVETASQEAARKLAEGKAIGSACRHAVRSIEDCYRSNPKAGKAAVFEGWREMDEYMRENKIEGMPFEKPKTLDMITEIEKPEKPAGGDKDKPGAGTAPQVGKVELPPKPTVKP